MKKISLVDLKQPTKVLKNYNSDLDFLPPNKFETQGVKLFKLIMNDLNKNFDIPLIKLTFKHNRPSCVNMFKYRGTDQFQFRSVNLSANDSYVLEYVALHEIAHIVEARATGTSSNRHGVKFNKYFTALQKRYNLTNL